MKRLAALILAFAMVVTMAACGGKPAPTPTENPAVVSPTPGIQASNSDVSDEASKLTEEITVMLAHDYDPNSANFAGMEWFASEVNKRSDGKIIIDIYGNGELSGLNSQVTYQLLQTGDVDMAIIPPPNTDQWQLFYLPFLFRDSDTALAACEKEGGQMMLKLLRESSGIEGLSFCPIGMRAFTNDVRPLELPEDMNGLKIRILDVPAVSTFIKTLGATPVATSMGELYLALQQGNADGQENPLSTIYSKAFYEVQDYLSITNHIWSFAAFGANAKFWDSLPEAAQNIIREVAVETGREIAKLAPGKEQEAYDKLAATGIKINTITDEQWEAWREACIPVHQAMEETITPEILGAFYDALGYEKTW